jgi:hypothetical protein
MAAILPLARAPFSAKREKLPPVRQPNQASWTREHRRPEKVERMILAARQAGGRVAERDAVLERIGKTACICQRHAAMKAVNPKAKNNFEAWGHENIGAEVLSVPLSLS